MKNEPKCVATENVYRRPLAGGGCFDGERYHVDGKEGHSCSAALSGVGLCLHHEPLYAAPPATVPSEGEGVCVIHPCDGTNPVHRFATAEAYLTMLLNDTERRVDGGKLYLLAVDTIYHLRALVRSAPFAPPAPPSAPAETEGERLRREAHEALDRWITYYVDHDPLPTIEPHRSFYTRSALADRDERIETAGACVAVSILARARGGER